MPTIGPDHFRVTKRAIKAQEFGLALRDPDLRESSRTRIEDNLNLLSTQAKMPIVRGDSQIRGILLDSRVVPALVALVWLGGAELNEVPDEVLEQLRESMRPHEVYSPTVGKIGEILETRRIVPNADDVLSETAEEERLPVEPDLPVVTEEDKILETQLLLKERAKMVLALIARGDGFPDSYAIRRKLGSDLFEPLPPEKAAEALIGQYRRWEEANNEGKLGQEETERLTRLRSLPATRGFGDTEPDVVTMLTNMTDDNFGWGAQETSEKEIRRDIFYARANQNRPETVFDEFGITEEIVNGFFELRLLPRAQETDDENLVLWPEDMVAAMYLNELRRGAARSDKLRIRKLVGDVGEEMEKLRMQLGASDNRKQDQQINNRHKKAPQKVSGGL